MKSEIDTQITFLTLCIAGIRARRNPQKETERTPLSFKITQEAF